MVATPSPSTEGHASMPPALGYAAQSADTPLAPFSFARRDVRPNDVAIDIL